MALLKTKGRNMLKWMSLYVTHVCLIYSVSCNTEDIFEHNNNNNPLTEASFPSSNSSALTYDDDARDQVLDDHTTQILVIVQYCIISTSICIFGIVTNIINIAVFIKQGFEDSINISLCGLAISDLSSLITLLWLNICFSPFLQSASVPFLPDDVAYLTAGWPRVAFSRITAFITAFITFERCLCITMPLKVKIIITPGRTCIIIVTIFILLMVSIYPTYYTSRLVWKWHPERNETVYGLTFTADRETIDSVMFALNNAALPMLAFITVSVCTTILITKLNEKSKWREKSAKTAAGSVSLKDRKTVKMISLISTIFILCFIPNVAVFSAMASVPEFNIDGQYRNMFIISFSYCFILESINSSINLLIYMKMSSKFREAFNKLFKKDV